MEFAFSLVRAFFGCWVVLWLWGWVRLCWSGRFLFSVCGSVWGGVCEEKQMRGVLGFLFLVCYCI